MTKSSSPKSFYACLGFANRQSPLYLGIANRQIIYAWVCIEPMNTIVGCSMKINLFVPRNAMVGESHHALSGAEKTKCLDLMDMRQQLVEQ